MEPQIAYSVISAIKERHSVRTFSDKPIEPETIEKIQAYIKTLTNPFGVQVKIGMVRKDIDAHGEKLSTYGFIKGANTFLGVWVSDVPNGLLAAGYEFEDLILYLTSLGINTVWIAGTLTREKFAKALGVGKNEFLPAVSPIGYAAEKKRFFEKIARKTLGADKRKPWNELFFEGSLSKPLDEHSASKYAQVLEMVRLGPSATNAQPWRAIKRDDSFDFYEVHKPGAKDAQIKQVDMGIALCHFELTLKSEGISGNFFDRPADERIGVAADYHYVISWKAN